MDARLTAVVALLALAACTPHAPPTPEVRASVAPSQLSDLRLVATRSLPHADRRGADPECAMPAPHGERSTGARAAMDVGWDVLEDAPLGRYRGVAVARGFDVVAGLGCQPRGASVLVFDGAQLVGIVYSRRDAFTFVERIDGPALRLADVTAPAADLRVVDDVVRLQRLPTVDLRCDGRARVPRVESTRYLTARRALLEAGWQPITARSEADALTANARQAGFVEVDGCAGTGLGQCLMRFRNTAGDALEITTLESVPSDADGDGRVTADETPVIAASAVACAGTPRAGTP